MVNVLGHSIVNGSVPRSYNSKRLFFGKNTFAEFLITTFNIFIKPVMALNRVLL